MKHLSARILRRTSVSLLILSAAIPGALAQELPLNTSSNNANTLDGLVAEALEKSPELKFYQAEIAAAKGSRLTAGQFSNPELGAGIGQKTIRGGGLNAEGLSWSVSIMQPFEWPGRLGLRKAIANQDIELAELGLARFKTALAGRMRTVAYSLFAAQEKAKAAEEVAERFKSLREVMVQRDPAGLTPLLETRVIEATELNTQRKASEALLSAQRAVLELNQLRGVAPETRVSVSQTGLRFRPPEKSATLMSWAMTNNFELRVRAIELAQQGFRVELARNERFQGFSVGPMVSEDRAGDRERIIGVGLTIPLPLWNRNAGNIETAKARQVQAETSLYITHREVERKVMDAALTYESKLREMTKWRPDAVKHFKDASVLADRHYRLGAVPIATYVELQKQYLEAVESLLDTKKEALEAASQLEVLTGFDLPFVSTAAPEEAK